MNPSLESLEEFALGSLIRYLRPGQKLGGVPVGRLEESRDVEQMRLLWAISHCVQDLALAVSERRQELETSLRQEIDISGPPIKGVIDVGQSLILQLVRGDDTVFATRKSFRSAQIGPNLLLCVVLYDASLILEEFVQTGNDSIISGKRIGEALQVVRAALQIEPIRTIKRDLRHSQRGTNQALLSAERSRKLLYRQAANARRIFNGVNHWDEQTLRTLVSEAVAAPKERWRLFELCVAISIAEAINQYLGSGIRFSLIGDSATRTIIDVGTIAIRWQNHGSDYSRPQRTEIEKIGDGILASLGLGQDTDRPDIVVFDKTKKKTIAVAEAKLYGETEEAARRAVRRATRQLVDYARGYCSDEKDIFGFLSRSVVVIGSLVSLKLRSGGNDLLVSDWSTLSSDLLNYDWVRKILL